jgi:hypothetical protein
VIFPEAHETHSWFGASSAEMTWITTVVADYMQGLIIYPFSFNWI